MRSAELKNPVHLLFRESQSDEMEKDWIDVDQRLTQVDF
jgi:hypothetical protein